MKISNFREPSEFRKDMDSMLEQLCSCTLADGAERVYFAGQREREFQLRAVANGLPLSNEVYLSLKQLSAEMDVELFT